VSRLLGLDIGGSTTRARLVIDEEITAEATAASASMTAAGPARAEAALTDLLTQLPDVTGSLDAVCAGAAGLLTAQQETRAFLQDRLAPLTISGRVVVVDDASLILPAAGLTEGIAVICGTGSIAVAHWQGRRVWAGGWGYLLGDEGSGYWIVRSAIRALLARRAQGLPLGALGGCLLEAAAASDLDALRAAFYRQPAPRTWARYAPAVLDCPDPEAARLTRDAANALRDLVVSLARQLPAADGIPVVLAGGLMAHSGLLAATVDAIGAALPASPARGLTDPPVAGAIRLAADAADSPTHR
jgi:N-acetylglucosamine kinase-like BadF-type ATPase